MHRTAGEGSEDELLRLKSAVLGAESTDVEVSSKECLVDVRGPRGGTPFERVALSEEPTRMSRHPVFRFFWLATNILLIFAIAASIYGSIWEYSTRQYLRGFSDAVVPSGADTTQKVEAILAWMQHGPSRNNAQDPSELTTRDPFASLNFRQLLEVCGGATNAFVNLAMSSGVSARRLLLLDSRRMTTHVVAEVKMDGRWIVVDPGFHFIARDGAGRYLTREDLEDPRVLERVTAGLSGYSAIYNYSSTAHVRLSRIPVVGVYLRRILSWIWPSWEESVNWTLLLERDSFAFFAASILALVFMIFLRQILAFYGERKLGVERKRLRQQFWQAGTLLLGQQP